MKKLRWALLGLLPLLLTGAAPTPGPGVPTPTGTLEGVARFTWSGSAWEPHAQAGAGVPTPTGTLRGTAPFIWNGTKWQAATR